MLSKYDQGPPDPETRSPAVLPGTNGAGVSADQGLRRGQIYHAPAQVIKAYPDASWLTVSDGRERIGLVLDTRRNVRPGQRSPLSPSYAFDDQDRFVGEFGSRKIAAAAISARRDHDRRAA